MTLLVALLAPAVVEEEVESNVTGGDTDSLQGSDSCPLDRQVESCSREEWTGEGKPH